ncbi:hypothetical protein [uncultured Amphritea sp.]|uniref:hypothetical protein n=1 Tax=uncultured Amphritea sp. TaxID=981605 RepID=UPI00260F7BE9|nr:hypothetical protein [uncultured Amphritea sp.]
MRDIADLNHDQLPSAMSLIKATMTAIAGALVLLVVIILPAEYGLDPTGLGKQLGLTILSVDPSEVAINAQSKTMDTPLNAYVPPVWIGSSPFRSDEVSMTLKPGKGAEIKARMKSGENFVFNWKAQGGDLYFDMHGEKIDAGDEFTSYWLERSRSSASGSFEAPFDGTHGWYWKNNGTEMVTVFLEISGFYEALFKP